MCEKKDARQRHALPASALDAYVCEYNGYEGSAPRLRTTSSSVARVILSFELAARSSEFRNSSAPHSSVRCPGVIAGLSDHPLVEDWNTEQESVELGYDRIFVDLTPIGARLLLGLPLSEIAYRVVDAVDVLGRGAEILLEQLKEAREWHARCALLDDFFLERAGRAPQSGSGASAAAIAQTTLERLQASRGVARIRDIVRDLGYSNMHLIRCFRDQVGVSPHAAKRIIRCTEAVRAIRAGHPLSWVAAEHGYADQAHLTRECKRLCGSPPSLIRDMHDGRGGAVLTIERIVDPSVGSRSMRA